ncbi:MAG: phosphate ABC transporter permease PstA [Nitrospina sp.]|jgi:phosphate transport system permease protein|nr:phosphate ABC transporter permease PstA [Nitrospina sp.]MBT5633241.1 phosphate ABC transporter permease PstA [Nitrospina sp.]
MFDKGKKVWKRGDLFIWLTGAGLALSLIMTAALLMAIVVNAMGSFWPGELKILDLKDGSRVLGIQMAREVIPDFGPANGKPELYRIQIKKANRDIYNSDFVWIDEESIKISQTPKDVVAVTRREWGVFFGYIKEVLDGDQVIAKGTVEGLKVARNLLPGVTKKNKDIEKIEKKEIGAINYKLERVRLKLRKLNLKGVTQGAEVEALKSEVPILQSHYDMLENKLHQLRTAQTAKIVLQTLEGREKTLPLSQMLDINNPNAFSLPDKIAYLLKGINNFFWDDPREANTEGGVFPAIYGTILMVLMMSLLATPLGVLAAFYLREYAKQGTLVSIVRIAVNNLAGIPSIVIGVFGVGFFIYFIGGSIDQIFFSESLPTPTFGTGGILWASLTMALLTVPVVIVSTEEGLAAVPKGIREASLAVGATKFETTWRVVLPAVMPSVLTGLILAMARAAGEVAPLMITGVVKLAPSLPIDGLWPFLHLERKFMHLGFHIYDVGFQSPNVDAARPMVFATTLLLLLMIILLNMAAIYLRNRLRKQLTASAV